jgi:hypothetical protein
MSVKRRYLLQSINSRINGEVLMKLLKGFLLGLIIILTLLMACDTTELQTTSTEKPPQTQNDPQKPPPTSEPEPEPEPEPQVLPDYSGPYPT